MIITKSKANDIHVKNINNQMTGNQEKINKADIIKDNEKINKIKTSEAVQYRNCHENKNNGILKEHNHYNNNIG